MTVEKLDRANNASKGVISGFVFKIIGVVLPFVIRTVIIKELGAEYLGLSSLFTSILSALNLVELGLGSSMVFSMYQPVAEKDYLKLGALYNFYRLCYRIIGVIILVLGLIVSPLLPYIVKGDFPSDINVYILYWIYLLNTVLSYWLFAYKSSLLQAYQRTDIESKIGIIVNIFFYGSQILVLCIFHNYYIYAIMLPIFTIATNIIRSIIVDKMFRNIKCAGGISREAVKGITTNMVALIGHQISYTVINSVDNIVISAFLGLTILAMYNNYYFILNALNSIIVVIFQAVQAGIGNSIITESKEKNRSDFSKFALLIFMIVAWATICLYTLCQDFILLWVGREYVFGYTTVIYLSICFFITQFRKVVTTYKNAAGYWKKDALKPYIVILVDLLIDIILIPLIGADGALIATIVSMGFVSIPWETWVLFKFLFEESPLKYFVFIIIQAILTGIGCILCNAIIHTIHMAGLMGFIVKGLCCSVIAGIYVLFVNSHNKNMKWIFNLTKNLLNKSSTFPPG